MLNDKSLDKDYRNKFVKFACNLRQSDPTKTILNRSELFNTFLTQIQITTLFSTLFVLSF